MEILDFDKRLNKFYINPNANKMSGQTRDTFYTEPLGGLAKPNYLPTPNTTLIGLINTFEVWLDRTLLFSIVTQSEGIINYSNPNNEKEIFIELANKCVNAHYELLTIKKSKTIFADYKFRVTTMNEVEAMAEQMQSFFHSRF